MSFSRNVKQELATVREEGHIQEQERQTHSNTTSIACLSVQEKDPPSLYLSVLHCLPEGDVIYLRAVITFA